MSDAKTFEDTPAAERGEQLDLYRVANARGRAAMRLMMTSPRDGLLRILSVSAEPPRPGSAARTHLTAIRDALRAEGHSVEELWRTADNGNKLFSLARFQLRGARRIHRADVVYMRWHVLDVVHVVFARALRKRIVLEVNGTSDDILLENPRLRFAASAVHALARITLRAAHHVIVVSPGLKGWVHSHAPCVPVTFLANGAHASLAHAAKGAATPPYAVFVGEFARHQGLNTLLRARRRPEWPTWLSLVVVGSGALQAEIEAAAQLNMLVHHGRLPQHEAHDVLAQATLSVSPQSGLVARNRLGVTPLKVAESMMLGVPVVGARLPGLTEIIGASPAGSTFAPDDPADLAQAVARVAQSVSDRERLRQYAVETLSWEAVGRATAAICAGADND